MKHWLFAILFIFTAFSPCCFGEPVTLRVTEREIVVNGKQATVYGIVQPNGINGAVFKKGETFEVNLENTLRVPTSVHWHGLILPNGQDGVAFITQYAIYPGTQYHYQFLIVQAGTFFMHSHYGLQEQNLLSAPLILHGDEDAKIADQEVVVLLSDFSFKPASQIYQELRCDCKKKAAVKSNMGSSQMKMHSMDLVEVDYDAFLANSRTLDNPDVFEVKAGSKVRLRLINASSATNFFIDVDLPAEAIAVDGSRIHPFNSAIYELGVAQRIDIIVTIPQQGGSFPVIARGEGTNKQTGILLTTPGSETPKLKNTTLQTAGALTNQQELSLKALTPLPQKKVDRKIQIELGGDMLNYIWTLNGQAWPETTPVIVKKGERVEVAFKNTSTMTHPMHLHGHVFQVTGINDKKINGAVRDTVLVMPNSTVTIQFDADNPGVWPLHCHVLYHLEAGMFTVVRYEDYIQPLTQM